MPGCDSHITIFSESEQVVIRSCSEPVNSFIPPSALPVSRKLKAIGCGSVQSVSAQKEEFRSTPFGQSNPKIVAMVKTEALLNIGQVAFAKITGGWAWQAAEGQIEHFRQLGAYTRLVIDTSKQVPLCR